MLKLKGQVLNVDDRQIQFRAKDSEGNRTGPIETHRSLTIQLLVKDETGIMFAVAVRKFDPDADFKLPKVGTDWQTPPIQKYEVINGIPDVRI